LIGMAIGLVFVGVIFLWMTGMLAFNGQTPQGAETQIDGRTGEQTTPAPALDGSEAAPLDGATTPVTPAPANPVQVEN
jgi:hypothetical protein